METEKMIMELRRIAKNHKNDRLCTGELNLTDMCTDVADRLEELNEFDKSQSAKLRKKLATYEDLGVTPEQIREIDRLYAEKCREVVELKRCEWIPVDERLPEVGENALVTYGNGEIQVDFIGEDGDWFWEDREDGIEVIAWMPLPEGYRPE